MLPQYWCLLSKEASMFSAVVPAQAHVFKQFVHNDVAYSTFTQSPKNSFIIFRSRSTDNEEVTEFGRIFSIFTHRRASKPSQNILDTWLHVHCFPDLPSASYNPFKELETQDVEFHIRAWGPTDDRIISINDVVAHCAWMMYRPGEIHKDLKVPTVALISMER